MRARSASTTSTGDNLLAAISCARTDAGSREGSAAIRLTSFISLPPDEGQIDEPGLRRDEALDLRTHRAGVEIVDGIEQSHGGLSTSRSCALRSASPITFGFSPTAI